MDALVPIDPYRRGLPAAAKPSEESFDFSDILDVVNPLQHLPGINWLYREISGDTIKTPAAIAGSALYGGAVGFAGALLAAAIESLIGETPEGLLSRAMTPAAGREATAAYGRAAALADAPNQR